jgi:hypothetical protein
LSDPTTYIEIVLLKAVLSALLRTNNKIPNWVIEEVWALNPPNAMLYCKLRFARMINIFELGSIS